MFNKPTMSIQLKYKKPSAKLMMLINDLSGQYKSYTIKSSDLIREILEQSDKEQIPKEQLRGLVEKSFKQAGLSISTMRRVLPPELKNKNMVRQHPKKEPLVGRWQIRCDAQPVIDALQKIIEAGRKQAIIVHDNKKVVDIQYEE